jgi:hypothetical protein
MKLALRMLLATFVLLVATAVFGQEVDTTVYHQEPEPVAPGGNYVACSAYGKFGQTCQSSTYDDWYQFRCIQVTRHGSCQCDAAKKKTSGVCTYQQ